MSVRQLPSHPFPIGQAVAAYPLSNWLYHQRPPSGAPLGGAAENVNVAADGSLAFLTLLPNTRYVAYAQLGGVHTYVRFTTEKIDRKPIATAAGIGDQTIVAAVPGRKIKLIGYVLSAQGAVQVQWKSGAANNLSGGIKLADAGGVSHPAEDEAPPMETRPGEALVLNQAQAIAVGGHVLYSLDPPDPKL